MKKKSVKNLALTTIFLLLPFLIYSVFKNGYLLYKKELISLFMVFKPLYFVLIGIVIKLIIDLIKKRKICIDYDLVLIIISAMIIPYNTSFIVYSISVLFVCIISIFIEKKLSFNKACLIYLINIIILYLLNNLTFKTPLDLNYTYNYSFLNLLLGRQVGGISSTSILFSIFAYLLLFKNFYYKKDVPFFINITYLVLIIIYSIFIKSYNYLLNPDLLFASVFLATIPQNSPYKRKSQIIYAILIGILSFVLVIFINKTIAVYLAIFILSIKIKNKRVA